MKFATYRHAGNTVFGLVTGNCVRGLSCALPDVRDLRDLIEKAEGDVARYLATRDVRADAPIALADVELLAPILRPSKFLGLGGNYREHRVESEAARSTGDHQIWFNKQTSCVTGPNHPILKPAGSDELDYEGELGVVIGKRCRNVKAADAAEFIFGFLVCNDISVRDWQARSPTHTLGKSFDTHGPIGPWITTADEVDIGDLSLRTFVNGSLRQKARTSDMIFSVGEMIEELSSAFTLEPGDILATGTPSGVGKYMIPAGYLNIGDIVRVEIETLGFIENTVTVDGNNPSTI